MLEEGTTGIEEEEKEKRRVKAAYYEAPMH
jgi:hypothetical protein